MIDELLDVLKDAKIKLLKFQEFKLKNKHCVGDVLSLEMQVEKLDDIIEDITSFKK